MSKDAQKRPGPAARLEWPHMIESAGARRTWLSVPGKHYCSTVRKLGWGFEAQSELAASIGFPPGE